MSVPDRGGIGSCRGSILKDVSGEVYNYLTVVGRVNPSHLTGNMKYPVSCICRCGSYKITNLNSLRTGRVKSCGCYNRELVTERNKTHGLYSHPIAKHWRGMHTRSKKRINSGDPCEIYPPWKSSLPVFIEWAEKSGWLEGLFLCRNGDKGDYHPDNVRWDTRYSNIEESTAKFYKVVRPNCSVVIVYNISKFGRSEGISGKALGATSRGEFNTYKGYRCYQIEKPEWFDYNLHKTTSGIIVRPT